MSGRKGIQTGLKTPQTRRAHQPPRNQRKRQLIQLGYKLGHSHDEIRAQLRSEGFSDTWAESMQNGERIISFEDPEEDDEQAYRLKQPE